MTAPKAPRFRGECPALRCYPDIPSIKNLETKGFHYCEDHRDVRPTVIDLISELPFEAYIYYNHKEDGFCPSDGFDWYNQLFGKLMHDRLRKYESSSVSICFEQYGNSLKVRKQELENIVERLVSEIRLKDVVNFPFSPVVYSSGKEESCLAISDYVAAIFKDYEDTTLKVEGSEVNRDSSSWQSRHFSMLRPKIRVIHNYGTGEFFTRHNPFP